MTRLLHGIDKLESNFMRLRPDLGRAVFIASNDGFASGRQRGFASYHFEGLVTSFAEGLGVSEREHRSNRNLTAVKRHLLLRPSARF